MDKLNYNIEEKEFIELKKKIKKKLLEEIFKNYTVLNNKTNKKCTINDILNPIKLQCIYSKNFIRCTKNTIDINNDYCKIHKKLITKKNYNFQENDNLLIEYDF